MKSSKKYTGIITLALILFTPFLLIAIDLIGNGPDTEKKSLSATQKTPIHTISTQSNSSKASTGTTLNTKTSTPSPSPSLTQTPTPSPTPPPASSTGFNPADYLIAIDAGHGAEDTGTQSVALGYTIYEKDVTIEIAKILEKLLKDEGYRVFMIRTGETNPDRRERIKMANAQKCSLYISIHCDWFSDPSVSGTTTYYSHLNTNTLGSLTHYSFASSIHKRLMEHMPTYDRGLREQADFAVLRLAEMPSVLLELGFMSNYGDTVVLMDNKSRENICKGIVAGINESLRK